MQSKSLRTVWTACCVSVAAGWSLPGASSALEKTSRRIEDTREEWGRAATCQILYYNTCQQWVWVWSGWDPTDKFGTVFSTTACCAGSPSQQLTDFFIWAPTPSPSGYGFTGTLEVHAVDAQDCPSGPALRSQPFLPGVSGWNAVDWTGNPVDVTGGDFLVTYTLANTMQVDPVEFGSDHPLAGPTGPAACGTCFPTTRVTHSYFFGDATTPLCPPVPQSDGFCNVEWLMDVNVECTVSVEDNSWGQIKALYR